MFYHIACGNAMTDEKKGGRRKEEGGRRREELSGGGDGRFGRDGGLKKQQGPRCRGPCMSVIQIGFVEGSFTERPP